MTTYKEVNAAWPDPVPVPSNCEAIHGVRHLIRRAFALAKADGCVGFAGYKPYMRGRKFKITTGRRRTSIWRGVVNPNECHRGWAEIVHSVSHWAQHRFWPKEDSHGPRHVWLEKELATYAIESMPRWAVACSGSEMRKKPKPDVKQVRAARVAARLAAWEAKRKRADTALRKLRKQARYYGLETTC